MSRRLLLLLLVLAALLLALLPLTAANAQCSIQSSWGLYYVRAGETLTRLAQRFGTTVNTLMNGNCLTGSGIFAGQGLRVPPGRIADADLYVGATYQAFEGGFMVWSGDSSSVSVYYYSTGRLESFSARTYSTYPPPAGLIAPTGRVTPQNGFGRVWNGLARVRNGLGWAITGERGFTMLVRYNANARVDLFSLPDGSVLYRNGAVWALSSSQVPPPPPPTIAPPTAIPPTPYPLPNPPNVGSTYQGFDGGFMVWRADTSEIYVYLYATSEMFIFPPSRYGSLSINYALTPPFNRYRPDNGFGRIWSNFGNLRGALGWGTSPESGFLSLVYLLSNGQTYSFTLPNGATATRVNDRFWTLTGGYTSQPAPIPSPTPTVIPFPPSATTQIAFQCYERGYMIWRSDTGDVYALIGREGGVAYRYLVGAYSGLPDPVGSAPPGYVFPVNAFGKVCGNFPLHEALGYATRFEQGLVVNITSPGDPNYVQFGVPGGGAVNVSANGFFFPSGGNTAGCP